MTTPTASEAARALAAQRPRATYSCEVCGQEFEARAQGGTDPVRTCSQACRSKRHYREKKARKPKQ